MSNIWWLVAVVVIIAFFAWRYRVLAKRYLARTSASACIPLELSTANRDEIYANVLEILRILVKAWNRDAEVGRHIMPDGVPMRVLEYPNQYSVVALCGRDAAGPQSHPAIQVTVRENGSVHVHVGSYGPEYVVEVLGQNLCRILGDILKSYMGTAGSSRPDRLTA